MSGLGLFQVIAMGDRSVIEPLSGRLLQAMKDGEPRVAPAEWKVSLSSVSGNRHFSIWYDDADGTRYSVGIEPRSGSNPPVMFTLRQPSAKEEVRSFFDRAGGSVTEISEILQRHLAEMQTDEPQVG